MDAASIAYFRNDDDAVVGKDNNCCIWRPQKSPPRLTSSRPFLTEEGSKIYKEIVWRRQVHRSSKLTGKCSDDKSFHLPFTDVNDTKSDDENYYQRIYRHNFGALPPQNSELSYNGDDTIEITCPQNQFRASSSYNQPGAGSERLPLTAIKRPASNTALDDSFSDQILTLQKRPFPSQKPSVSFTQPVQKETENQFKTYHGNDWIPSTNDFAMTIVLPSFTPPCAVSGESNLGKTPGFVDWGAELSTQEDMFGDCPSSPPLELDSIMQVSMDTNDTTTVQLDKSVNLTTNSVLDFDMDQFQHGVSHQFARLQLPWKESLKAPIQSLFDTIGPIDNEGESLKFPLVFISLMKANKRNRNQSCITTHSNKAISIAVNLITKNDNSFSSSTIFNIPFTNCIDLLAILFQLRHRVWTVDAKSILSLIVQQSKTKSEDIQTAVSGILNMYCPMDLLLLHYLMNPEDACYSLNQLFNSNQIKVEKDAASQLRNIGVLITQWMPHLKSNKYLRILQRLELPLVGLLVDMETTGIKLDTTVLVEMKKLLGNKLLELERKCHDSVGSRFSVQSHPQLKAILYDQLKLHEKVSKQEVKESGLTRMIAQRSSNETVLQHFSKLHALPGLIIQYRQVSKVKSTYCDGFLPFVSPKDSRIRGVWDQASAVTGRLYVSQPNLQSIPRSPLEIDGEAIGNVRRAFTSGDGVLVSADFSQIELRLFAHLARDPTLLAVFNDSQPRDVFVDLARMWLCKSANEDVTKDERELTKRLVYASLYGAGKEKLAEILCIPLHQAADSLAKFNVRIPTLQAFTKRTLKMAESYGYIETLFGRSRYFSDLKHSNFSVRMRAQRQVVNYVIQGSAAELCKAVMILVQKIVIMKGVKSCRLLLQLHDELLWEVSKDHLDIFKNIVIDVMQNGDILCQTMGTPVRLLVPLKIHFKTGFNLADMTEVKT